MFHIKGYFTKITLQVYRIAGNCQLHLYTHEYNYVFHGSLT